MKVLHSAANVLNNSGIVTMLGYLDHFIIDHLSDFSAAFLAYRQLCNMSYYLWWRVAEAIFPGLSICEITQKSYDLFRQDIVEELGATQERSD